jgi:hypothetical protein
MLFVEWWLIGRVCLGLFLIIVLPVFGFWVVRNKPWPVRIPVRVLSALIMLCGGFLWFIVLSLPGNSYSAAAYSPNKKTAVRIADYNASGLGGADTSVELFTFHGLERDVVYFGEWKSVGTDDLRWRNDSELDIYHDGSMHNCKSTQHVLVRCIPKAVKSW